MKHFSPDWVVRVWDWISQVIGSIITLRGLALCNGKWSVGQKASWSQDLVGTISGWKNVPVENADYQLVDVLQVMENPNPLWQDDTI